MDNLLLLLLFVLAFSPHVYGEVSTTSTRHINMSGLLCDQSSHHNFIAFESVQDNVYISAWEDFTHRQPFASDSCVVTISSYGWYGFRYSFVGDEAKNYIGDCGVTLNIYDRTDTSSAPAATYDCVSGLPTDGMTTDSVLLTIQLINHNATNFDFTLHVSTFEDNDELERIAYVAGGVFVGLFVSFVVATIASNISRSRRSEQRTLLLSSQVQTYGI